MIRFIRAHGYDPAPTQRPVLCGALSGAIAVLPTGVVLVAFNSFSVAAEEVIRLPPIWTAAVIFAAFLSAGLLYGALFRRAADDDGVGWLLGMAYGFVIWAVAPVTALPLLQGSAMASGSAAIGFLVSFLVWGLCLGVVFPLLHKRLHARLGPRAESKLGPESASTDKRLLRRT